MKEYSCPHSSCNGVLKDVSTAVVKEDFVDFDSRNRGEVYYCPDCNKLVSRIWKWDASELEAPDNLVFV